MTVQRKSTAARETLAINTRSVDTKRAIRIGNGAGAAASEWRQFTLGPAAAVRLQRV